MHLTTDHAVSNRTTASAVVKMVSVQCSFRDTADVSVLRKLRDRERAVSWSVGQSVDWFRQLRSRSAAALKLD